MLDLYYLKPYLIVPTLEQHILQRLSEDIAAEVGVPITLGLSVIYGNRFEVRIYNFDGADATARGDDLHAVVHDAVAMFSGQVVATEAYKAEMAERGQLYKDQ